MPIKRHMTDTTHGSVAVEESGSGELAVVFIHGNSSSHEVFRHQMGSSLARRYRLIAFDLPGHGQSANAINPARTYTLPGYAEVTHELIGRLGLSQPVLVGWSLGGHIALELAARFQDVAGMMISGAPPVAPGRMADGFIPALHFRLGSKERFTAEDVEDFGRRIFGESFTPALREAIARTDGIARKTLFEGAQAGLGTDQRHTVETSPIPLAVVSGATDAFVNLDYLDSLAYAHLWEGRCYRLPGLGHAPFWEGPEAFNPLLARFLGDIAAGQA